MFLGYPIADKTFDDLSGNLIIDILIFGLLFKIEVSVVKIAHACVSLYHSIALFNKMFEIAVIAVRKDIHKAKNVLMRKIMVTIEIVRAVDGMQLASRIQDTGKGKKHIDGITVESDLAIAACLPEERREVQRRIELLEIEIAYIGQGGI